MKKIYLFFTILFATNTYGNQYVPLVTDNAEWQILYTSYPYEFQLAKTFAHQIYTLYGDTIIADLTYKKICLKANIDGQPKYIYFGAIREQNKRIYYIGNGYFTSSPNYNINAAKIKAMNECFSSYNYDSKEVLLYDFNSKPGDYVEWGYSYRQIIYEDYVLVGNLYRRCLHMSDNDKIVEGIGSVIHGTLSSVSPMPMCSNYFNSWEFEAFKANGEVVYKSTKDIPSLGYQTIYSQRIAFYKTDNNKTETLKIDSCVFFNDTVLYPLHNLQLIGDECYDPNGNGWTGKKIVFNNQWNYFFNDDSDTIKIKTDAVLNESWILFQRPDITVSATVTKWDTTTILGVVDSVKTIALHVFDNSMKPISHEFENATIAISKHFGLIKAVNFTYFPALKYRPANFVTKKLELVGIMNPKLGIQNIKWFDVFDFQVGDEFHYTDSYNYLMFGGSASERKYIIRILKRENFNDSIRYTENVQSTRKFKLNLESEYIITSEHYQDTNLIRRNAEFDQEPGVPVFNKDSSSLQIYPTFNIVSAPEIYSKDNGCWHRSLMIDDACNILSYAKGRGLISSSSGCWEWQSYDRKEQVYYKKGSVTWGTPLVLTSNEEVNARFSINIYPNPTTDKIYIDLNDNSNCSFELFDTNGKSLVQKKLNLQKNSVNMLEFSKGIYFYRIIIDDKQVKTGKIIME